MSAKKRKKKKSSGQGANFVITLVTLSVIFVFFGYLIGTYAVSVLREQHQASMQLARQETSVPVVRSETSSAPATSTLRHLRLPSPSNLKLLTAAVPWGTCTVCRLAFFRAQTLNGCCPCSGSGLRRYYHLRAAPQSTDWGIQFTGECCQAEG